MVTGESHGALAATQEQMTVPTDSRIAVGEVALTGPENYKTESWERFLAYVKKATEGPQREGLYPDDKDRVLDDPRTTCVTICADGAEMLWPLITPIANNGEYAPGYFDRMEGSDNTYYVSLPPARLLESPQDQEAVGSALLDRLKNGSLLVYDEIDGQCKDQRIRAYLSTVSDVEIEVDGFVDPENGSQAGIAYFNAPIMLRDEAGEPFPSQAVNFWRSHELLVARGEITNTRMIDADSDTAAVDGLWEIYRRQFKTLLKDFPRNAQRSEEQFRAMLSTPTVYTVAHFEQDEYGKDVPVAFATFMTDVAHCGWLNADYFEETFPQENMLYISSVASHPDRRGQVYTANILKLFEQLSTVMGSDYRVAFLCTNVSADYIPRILKRGIRNSIATNTPVADFAHYAYRGIRLAR